MPSILLHPPSSTNHASSTPNATPENPLPQLLQTPSGLAILELQGTINVPSDSGDGTDPFPSNEISPEENTRSTPPGEGATSYETPVGKLLFPDYNPQMKETGDESWMKRVYLYVGRFQRMSGEVSKLRAPVAVIRRREGTTPTPAGTGTGTGSEPEREELEIVEIVRYKMIFKNRPEPVNDG